MFRPQLVTQERVSSATRHDIPVESVREQLARILNSETFAKAESLRRLLDYLVARGLAGNASGLKEYVVGVEVFDRGEHFDPTLDTIVRVQARRLREKLRHYYASEGRRDPVYIELPKGRYAALFRFAPVSDASDAPVLIRTPGSTHLEHGLPTARVPLVGREAELEAVTELLRCEHVRLLTLIGAGGSGKTCLALQAASDVREDFAGGVVFLDLACVRDVATVLSAIAGALGLRHTNGPNLLQEFADAAIRGPTLLILDGFEQVLEAGPLLVSLTEVCPPLKILVTSRAALHVAGENNYVVPSLATPDLKTVNSLRGLTASPAVRLFVRRAAAQTAGFTLNHTNASAVAEICRRLDGLPLAIELAAARIRVLSPAAMLPYLDRSLDFLSGGPRNLPVRQQSLRSSIDWSYALLDETEKMLFRRLSVFAGSFTLEGAAAVCNAVGDLDGQLLDILSSLIDKSLIHRIEQRGVHLRFAMPAAVREYGYECLEASGESEFIRSAHATYCIVLAEEAVNRRAFCASEQENLSAALDWLVFSGKREWAARLAALLVPPCKVVGR